MKIGYSEPSISIELTVREAYVLEAFIDYHVNGGDDPVWLELDANERTKVGDLVEALICFVEDNQEYT